MPPWASSSSALAVSGVTARRPRAARSPRPRPRTGRGPGGDLADVAAQPAQGRVLVEQVGAVAGDHGRDVGRVGGDDLDLQAHAGAHRLDDLVGLLGQAAGVQGQDPHAGVDLAGQVEHDHALGLEAGDHGELAPVGLDGPGQQPVGRKAEDGGEIRWVWGGWSRPRGQVVAVAATGELLSTRSGRGVQARSVGKHASYVVTRRDRRAPDTRRSRPIRGRGRGAGQQRGGHGVPR